MNKIHNNNLENLKALYSTYNTKKTTKEEKKDASEPVKEYEGKKVEASALEALAAQNRVQLNKVDTSDAATQKRLEQAMANSPFMKALNEINEFEEQDFVGFASANITGVNHEKLAKYLAKPLSAETKQGLINL